MSKLSHNFIQQLAVQGETNTRFKWYITTIVALSSLNYPDEIGPLYTQLLEKYIRQEDHYEETRKIKEALVKASGLHGAAKVSLVLSFFILFSEAKVEIDWKCSASSLPRNSATFD